MSDRKALLIRRWNKYHPINCEVARHIIALEQQGESIWTSDNSFEPCGMLNVLVLCLWAVEHPDIETRWWANDGDGGGMWIRLNSTDIFEIHQRWHPKTVMDFFKYEYDDDEKTDAPPTQILDHLKEATDPLNATHILMDVLSLNLSSFLFSHFISDNNDYSF